MAQNPILHHCTKHLAIDCHFTREKVLEGLFELRYVPTNEQLADVLTKIILSQQLQKLISKLSMTTITPHLRGDDEDIECSPDIR